MKNKRFISALVFLMILTLLPIGGFAIEKANEGQEKTVAFSIGQKNYRIGNNLVETDVAPYIKSIDDGTGGGRTMVPVAFVAPALGTEPAVWHPETRTVTIKKGSDSINITIGSKELIVNDKVVMMDVAAEIKDVGNGGGRTMLPIAFIAKALEVGYEWDGATKSVYFYGYTKNYEQKGTFGPASGIEVIEGSVVVKADGVILRNIIVKGNLTIAEEVGDGDVTLNNITVKGETYVRGGGQDSIHINGGQYTSIIVQNVNGKVRIVAKDVNNLDVIISEDANGEEIILEGSFGSVKVEAEAVKITAQGQTTIKDINVAQTAAGSTIHLGNETVVEKMVLSGNSNVTGTGTIRQAEVKAAGVQFEKAPEKQTVDQGVEAPKVTPPAQPAPVRGGGGGGGGGSTVPADLTAYNAALAAVIEADYTHDSWDKYQKAVAQNRVTAANTQAQVDAATAAIRAAQANLVTLVKAVELLITHLPEAGEVTLEDEDVIIDAIDAWNALTEEQRGLVVNADKFWAVYDAFWVLWVETLIAELPEAEEVTLEHEEQISFVIDEWNALTDEQRELVANQDKFWAVYDAFWVLWVETLIAELPEAEEVTLADQTQIEAAREAYDLLTAEQQALVTNLPLLEAAEAELNLLLRDIDEVEGLIADLPEAQDVTLEHREQINIATEAVDELTDEQWELVANKDKFWAVYDAFWVLWVETLIAELPEAGDITLEDEEQISFVIDTWNALTEEQRGLVANADKFWTVYDAFWVLWVETLIADLPEAQDVTLDDEEQINSAIDAWNALTDEQRELVANKDKFWAVYDAFWVLWVETLIAELPEAGDITLEDEEQISFVINEWNALTDEQRELVANADKLWAVYDAFWVLWVETLIAELPEAQDVTLDDGEQINSVIDAWNALTEDQRGLVANADKFWAVYNALLELWAEEDMEAYLAAGGLEVDGVYIALQDALAADPQDTNAIVEALDALREATDALL